MGAEIARLTEQRSKGCIRPQWPSEILAELRRREPELIPVLRRRAAGWCARNGLPEEAMEYTIAAGDVDMAAALMRQLAARAYRQGKAAAVQRWLRWPADRVETEGPPRATVLPAVRA